MKRMASTVAAAAALHAALGACLRRCMAPHCAVCGIEHGDPVCSGCLQDYFAEHGPRCRVCANALPAGAAAGPSLCGQCLARPRHFDRTIVLADYAPPVAGMIAALKFQARLDLGRAFGILLAQRAATLDADGLIALPLARERQRERGYNQAEEIARAVAASRAWPLLQGVLLRPHHRPSQQGLRRAQRRTNVRGVFQIAAAIDGRRLVLVDDVLTSGSTLDEAAACLKRAGAASVSNLVVARTRSPP